MNLKKEVPFIYHFQSNLLLRIKSSSRYRVVKQIEKGDGQKIGTLELNTDLEVQQPHRKIFLSYQYGLCNIQNSKSRTTYHFLTNFFSLNLDEIVEFYRKSWDIEVFFRFLKHQLDLSHITSTSEKGMQVRLYMTMITSILMLVYKRLNQTGYKTAVWRIAIELNEYMIKLIVKNCGGDPGLVFR